MPNRVTDPNMILDHVAMGPRGCWIYTGALDANGYGERIMVNYRRQAPHRWTYEMPRGPIPDGLQIDHLCKTPRCVNPDHLEATTARINVLRSDNPAAQNARKVDCKRGHPLTGANLYTTPDGRRQCRVCRGLRMAG